MEKRVIPFSPPDISELEINEVAEAMRSGWITTGPRTKELERRLAEYCHTSKVVCLNSATAAEELNFRVCGIGEGDEVIVPAYTYTASASLGYFSIYVPINSLVLSEDIPSTKIHSMHSCG